MSCPACAANIHGECYDPEETKCCCTTVESIIDDVKEKRGGRLKVDEDITDPQSTGRKRAAVLFPLDREASCEWAGLKYAGGGINPIIGCTGNKQTNRHHGPDKNTLNNEVGNVHRICAFCHNRWHAANDNATEGIRKEHDPDTKATEIEILHNEVYWRNLKVAKVNDDETDS